MNPQEFVIELPARHETILRLRIARADDRFAHWIELDHQGQIQTMAWSVEGAAADRWPASPPLIDLFPGAPSSRGTTSQHSDGPPGLLATGAAGSSFWSLAVTRAADAIVFEHACKRCEPVADFLGCTYRLPAPPDVVDRHSARFGCPWGAVVLAIHPLEGHQASMRWTGDQLVLETGSSHPTVRWQYQLAFDP